MANPRTFPRLRSSPNATNDANRPPDLRTFVFDAGSYRSLPHTPRSHHSSLSLGPRSIWVAMRRDRQSRIHSILEARSARGSHLSMQQRRQPESVIETLSPKELPKVLRMRAREVAWMLGQRTKPKAVAMSGLANALRTTAYDEDDVVADAIMAAERLGHVPDGGEQGSDFEAIQEIVSLRHTLRLLLRMQLEHPNNSVRKNVADILARTNSAKKTLKVPMPQALAGGPSFFFAAQKFAQAAQLRLADGLDMDDDSYSSSSDEFSDYDDGNNSIAAASAAVSAAQRINATAAMQSGRLGSSDQETTRAAHLMWVRKFAEAMGGQWHNGAPHLFQLLNPLPQCGFALSSTLARVFSVYRSGVKEPEAHFLFAAAAAQTGCYPLVCFAESRVMAACYDDDGDVYEEWLSRGFAAVSPKTLLLARFGKKLAERPWLVSAHDVQRYVDEYVRLHTEQHPHRPRGDSSSNIFPSPRLPVHRSLSTSVVSGATHSVPSTMNELSRRSTEENAIRDLLHTVVVMAVAHGLGSFATACGLTPDLDIPAGSFFSQFDGLVPVEACAGLAYVEPIPLPVNSESTRQPQISAAFVEQVEKNTVDLISRLQQPMFPESMSYDMPPLSAGSMSFQSQKQPMSSTAQAHSPMPRHISSADSRTSAYIRGLSTIPDPLTSQAPQFAAYQQMRAKRLSRYELPAYSHNQQHQHSSAVPHISTPSHYIGNEVPSSMNVSEDSAPVTASPLEMAHSIAFNLAQSSKLSSAHHTFAFSQPPTAACQAQYQPPPSAVHLSQSEDLRWDAVSNYLRQQLSINEDHLGAEVQAARNLVGRPFAEAQLEPTSNDTAGVYVAERCNAPVTSDGSKPEWDQSPESMSSPPSVSMMPKSYSLTNVLSLGGSADRGMHSGFGESQYRSFSNRAIDVRRFHDAIWHFTLSLFHIYEEYYFYNKFKDETTPDCSQSESAMSMPVHSPDVTGSMMGVDMDVDMGDEDNDLPSRSSSSQQYSRWITDELKEHIRRVVRNPASISALTAQPPVAAGINLCIEEMIHINLIISLARRQAEIIHGIRAIREYESLAHPQQ
ncbi:hypothetical protein GGH96_002884 [Coemansia sp. RSA 1972]|nr:hypothetical protein GGH96_002884 [Coemansia sp. RSA 1972]